MNGRPSDVKGKRDYMKNQSERAAIITEIQHLVPPGSPEPTDPGIISALKERTARLIEAYKADGKLLEDPLDAARNRTIYLYEAELNNLLAGKTVLITGGAGCVGQTLINKLRSFPVQRIVSLDI